MSDWSIGYHDSPWGAYGNPYYSLNVDNNCIMTSCFKFHVQIVAALRGLDTKIEIPESNVTVRISRPYASGASVRIAGSKAGTYSGAIPWTEDLPEKAKKLGRKLGFKVRIAPRLTYDGQVYRSGSCVFQTLSECGDSSNFICDKSVDERVGELNRMDDVMGEVGDFLSKECGPEDVAGIKDAIAKLQALLPEKKNEIAWRYMEL